MTIKKPRTILEFDEVELFETSAVGIPSYARAHKSFVKSLKNLFSGDGGSGLNLKELQNMSEEEEAKAKAEAEAAEAEAKAKADAEVADADDGDSEDGDAGDGAKSITNVGKGTNLDAMTKIMAKAVSTGIAEGMKAVQTEAGLTDTKTPAEKQADLMKNASDGEVFAAAFGMEAVQ